MPKSDDVPVCPSIPVVRSPGREVREYAVELITPLFGGGVEPRANDPSFPIRPTAIRGQLEFWWRATVGAQYATLAELRAAQPEVWGSTERASRVQVRVELLDEPGKPKACAVIRQNRKGKDQVFWEPPFENTALPYALFPFQGKPANREGPKIDPAQCIHKASFRLTVITEKHIDFAKQVEPALWAWVNFGGLGSRTRRGCGATRCTTLMPKDRNDLLNQLLKYLSTTAPRDWPTLAEAFCVGREFDKPLDAWNEVIRLFRHFRQGVGLGRNPGQQPNRPGRSRYPEPETIRRVTQQRLPRHQRLQQTPDDAFPRAELGLPIVFHFQEQGDPPDTALYPDNDAQGNRRERMASPLILKPLALHNGKFVPVIVRLKTPRLTGVDLRQGERSLNLPATTVIRDPRLSRYPNSPLAASPNGSAIETFIAFARGEGFTEVTR